jgi:hypothetical protein
MRTRIPVIIPAAIAGAGAAGIDAVIPGHGNIMTRADVREFRGKMLTTQLRARELISRGSGGFASSSIPGLFNEPTG